MLDMLAWCCRSPSHLPGCPSGASGKVWKLRTWWCLSFCSYSFQSPCCYLTQKQFLCKIMKLLFLHNFTKFSTFSCVFLRASLVPHMVKNPPAMQEPWETQVDPWVGKIPWKRKWPLQYSCLKNPRGQRSLASYSPWGCKGSGMTEQLSLSMCLKLM